MSKTCDESTGQDAESTNLKDDLSQDVLDVTKYDSLIQEIKAEQIKNLPSNNAIAIYDNRGVLV